MSQEDAEYMKAASLQMKAEAQYNGQKQYEKWVRRYNLTDLPTKSGQYLFRFYDKEYYYSWTKNRIREKGSNEWLGTIYQVFKDTPPQPSEDLFPLRKYQGQPFNNALNDQPYCYWLFSQNWLEDKYPDVLTRILEKYPQLKV